MTATVYTSQNVILNIRKLHVLVSVRLPGSAEDRSLLKLECMFGDGLIPNTDSWSNKLTLGVSAEVCLRKSRQTSEVLLVVKLPPVAGLLCE